MRDSTSHLQVYVWISSRPVRSSALLDVDDRERLFVAGSPVRKKNLGVLFESGPERGRGGRKKSSFMIMQRKGAMARGAHYGHAQVVSPRAKAGSTVNERLVCLCIS